MSRSYKKHHCVKDHNKFMKRYANRCVRRYLKNPEVELKGNAYRKFVESWDICDWIFYYPHGFEEYYRQEVKFWYNWRHRSSTYSHVHEDPFPDREKCWKEYQKSYVRK